MRGLAANQPFVADTQIRIMLNLEVVIRADSCLICALAPIAGEVLPIL
jgi:hypothetical protein